MKKWIALLLALTLLAIAPLSLADTVKLTENASGFDLTIDLPAGAQVNVQNNVDVPYTFITFSDETKPALYISVAPSEEYAEDATIATLSKEDLDSLFAVVSADLDSPSYTVEKTDGGYDYMLVQDDSQTDTALLILLYKGYFIQLTVWNANYAVLTDEQTAVATSLLDSLKIVDVQP